MLVVDFDHRLIWVEGFDFPAQAVVRDGLSLALDADPEVMVGADPGLGALSLASGLGNRAASLRNLLADLDIGIPDLAVTLDLCSRKNPGVRMVEAQDHPLEMVVTVGSGADTALLVLDLGQVPGGASTVLRLASVSATACDLANWVVAHGPAQSDTTDRPSRMAVSA